MKISRILGAVALVLAIALIATGIVGNTFRSGDHALAKDYQEAVSHEASIQKHADSAQKTAPSAVKKAETAIKKTDAAIKEADETFKTVTSLFEGFESGKINDEVVDRLMDASKAIEDDLEELKVFEEALSENAEEYKTLLGSLEDTKTDVNDTANLLVFKMMEEEFASAVKALNNAESKLDAAFKGVKDVYAKSDIEWTGETIQKSVHDTPAALEDFVEAHQAIIDRANTLKEKTDYIASEAQTALNESASVSKADSLKTSERIVLLIGKAHIFITLTGFILLAIALIAILIPGKFAHAWKHVPVFSTFITAIVMVIILTYAHGNTMNFAFESYGDWASKWLINMVNVLRSNASVGMVALGMTFVIITGGIDLAVGSTLAGISTVVMVILDVSQSGFFTAHGLTGWPNFLVAIGAGLLAGLILGGLTGVGITKGRVPPFIVTLGVMNIVRSVAQYFTKSTKIEVPKEFQVISNATLQEIIQAIARIFDKDAIIVFPEKIKFLGDLMLLQIFYWIILAVIMYVISKHTAFGRHIYAVGSNERTSRLSGINVDRVKIKVYMLMGLITAIAAITQVARLRGVDVASAGSGLEMSAIAAVVVGGTSMAGGRGSIVGTLLGVLIIGIMDTLVILLHIDAFLSNAFIGAIIIFAVLMQRKDK